MAADPETCCPHHPAIQLRRRHRSTGEWKIILPSCPLCASGLPGTKSNSSNNSSSLNGVSAELFEQRAAATTVDVGRDEQLSAPLNYTRATSTSTTTTPRSSSSPRRRLPNYNYNSDDDNSSIGSVRSTRSDARIVLNSTTSTTSSSRQRHRTTNMKKRWSNTTTESDDC